MSTLFPQPEYVPPITRDRNDKYRLRSGKVIRQPAYGYAGLNLMTMDGGLVVGTVVWRLV